MQKPGFSPDYVAAAARVDEHGRRAVGLGPDGGGAGAAPQQPAAAGLHRRQARTASRARTTTSVRAKRSRSSSSSSTIPGKPWRANASGRWACRSPSPAARRSPSRRASRNASRCASSCRPRCRPAPTNSPRPFGSAAARRRRMPSPSTSCRARPTSAVNGEDRAARSQGRDRQAAGRPGRPLPDGGGGRGPVRLRRADRRQGGADVRRARAGRGPGARRAEGHRVRADREGPGTALRLPRGGVRPAAGLPARAGPSAAGRPGRGPPARLARRGDASAAAAPVHAAAALRPDGAVVRHRRAAALALRLPRQRRLRADREAGARRFPADPRRRLRPAVQPAAGVPRGQGDGAVLPDGRDRTHGKRAGGGRPGPQPPAVRLGLEAVAASQGALRRRPRRQDAPRIRRPVAGRLREGGVGGRPRADRRSGRRQAAGRRRGGARPSGSRRAATSWRSGSTGRRPRRSCRSRSR